MENVNSKASFFRIFFRDWAGFLWPGQHFSILRRMASQRSRTAQKRKEVRTACNYFENNLQRMRYDEYLQAGYPIASGVIEGACRHMIKDRMEQGGMRWTRAGAQAMLNVRSVCASSEWEAFGTWRQEEQVLHSASTPGPGEEL